MKRPLSLMTILLLTVPATAVPATEIQTATTTSEHEIRLDGPVAGSQFPILGGEILAPGELESPAVPLPLDADSVIACTLHVENGGTLKRKVKARLTVDVSFEREGDSENLTEGRKTSRLGTAFFRLPIPNEGTPRAAAWTIELSRRRFDSAVARCQIRTFSPCAETSEIGCLGGRYAVRLGGATSLGGGAFTAGGQAVYVAVRDRCSRQSLKQVFISVDDDFSPSQGAVLEVRDTESGVVLRRDDLTLRAQTTISLSWPDTRCDPHLEGCRSPCP